MKNFKKVIGLFLIIFIIGICVTVITVNTSLNKPLEKEEMITVKKDTTSLLKSEKKTV